MFIKQYFSNRCYEMSDPSIIAPIWLTEWMEVHEITLWGAADLRDFSTPQDETGQRFPLAFSWAIPMNPQIMVSIRNGPNQAYADEYARVNNHINELSLALAAEIKARGFRSKPPSVRIMGSIGDRFYRH
jgi:epoxyqueuosine reductase